MDWLQQNFAPILSALIAVLFGGLAGNFYAQWRTDKRNARQKILRDFVVSRIHQKDPKANFKIAITEDGNTYQFENLYSISVQIVNKGNTAYKDFNLLISMPETFKILKATPNIINRARDVEFTSDTPSYSTPVESLNLELKPFNRNDAFSIDLLVFSPENDLLSLSSENSKQDKSMILIDTRADVDFITSAMFSENVAALKSKRANLILLLIGMIAVFYSIYVLSTVYYSEKSREKKDQIFKAKMDSLDKLDAKKLNCLK